MLRQYGISESVNTAKMTSNRKVIPKISKTGLKNYPITSNQGSKKTPSTSKNLKHPSIIANPALRDDKAIELNEEWSNFMQRVGQVSGLVKDMASGDKFRADAAHKLADQYLQGKVIVDEDVEAKVKDDRTVINQKAFKSMENKDSGEIDKDVWMAEMSKDADRRAQDRKVRLEKADTLKTMAVKAFRREEYDRALSCYNRAIEHVKDNPMFYCDRALTNIKLGNYDKVDNDCDMALRINDNSYKARLYRVKAHKELESDKFEELRQDLRDTFPQHEDLTKYFLDKKEEEYEEEEEEED